jgi:hypothetical protein
MRTRVPYRNAGDTDLFHQSVAVGGSELRATSGRVPEVQNLNYLWTLLNAVVDENWCMDKLANTRSTGHRAADIGKGS